MSAPEPLFKSEQCRRKTHVGKDLGHVYWHNALHRDEQMVSNLREADRTSVADAAKKHKVSEQTIYAWRKHFGELSPAYVKRLKRGSRYALA